MKNTARVLSKVFMKGLVMVLATLFIQGGTWAMAKRPKVMTEKLTAMTQNLYVGADITTVAAAEDDDEFFALAQAALIQIAANNFPERAAAIASEIAEKKPHLVGLQEVYNLTFNGYNTPIPPFRDYLEDLLDALEANGVFYEEVAVVKNLDIVITMPGYGDVGVIDRDVILARSDVAPTVEVVDLASLYGDCKVSVDGCNYHEVAIAEDTPVGDIAFERGFVAVDALIGDLPVRFVNTHLEVRYVDPENPYSPFIQAAQADELITVLSDLPKDLDRQVVVVGDINSSPEDEVIDLGGGFMIFPPYMQLQGAGYIDTWTLRPGKPPGFTCCQDENLLNPDSMLSERVDVIFVSESPVNKVKANVVGNDESDKTIPSRLWPSDHAGVVARMEFDAQ